MAIDYGTKRTGIAVTDPLQIIASGLTTVHTMDLMDFLARYLQEEETEAIVVGEPMHMDGNPTKLGAEVTGFVRKLRKQFPGIEVVTHDERFTSVDARQIILQSGIGQKKRRDKSLIDKVAAVLILEDYMKTIGKF